MGVFGCTYDDYSCLNTFNRYGNMDTDKNKNVHLPPITDFITDRWNDDWFGGGSIFLEWHIKHHGKDNMIYLDMEMSIDGSIKKYAESLGIPEKHPSPGMIIIDSLTNAKEKK